MSNNNLKRIILMAAVALMTALNVNAQDNLQNEISIAYGGGANSDIVSSIANGMFTGKQTGYWGPISLEYFHYLENSGLAFGGVAAISGCKWDDESSAKSTYFSLMPSVKYRWLNKKNFAMYSKAAIGLTINSESGNSKSETTTMFNWQASVIGAEFGGAFRGFVELGTGEQGIILAGLRYKF